MFDFNLSFAQAAYPGSFFQNTFSDRDKITLGVSGLLHIKRLDLEGSNLSMFGNFYLGTVDTISLTPWQSIDDPTKWIQVRLTDISVDVTAIMAVVGTPDTTDDLVFLRTLLAGNDEVILTFGDDTGFGWSGDDILDGRSGEDDLYGDTGNDTLIGGQGADALVGGIGTDTASYRTSAAPVTAALDGSLAATGDAVGDIYVSIENLEGSTRNDTLIGNIRVNLLAGGAGSDTLFGRGGNDTLSGGAGRDLFYGGPGADILTLGGGIDRVAFETIGQRGDVIAGFSTDDQFLFTRSAFGNLELGVIDASVFVSGSTNAAVDAADRFIFRTTDYTLWYDADGTGPTAAVMMADLLTSYVVQSDQILIVA